MSKASCESLLTSTAQQSQQSLNDCIDSNFNIDDLPTDGALQVKVVIIDKAGKRTTTNPQEEEGKQIVQSREFWQATANTILKHKERKAEVVKALK